jgi:hypothetical protein
MYPQNPQINPYDPKTLDALGEAFDATCLTAAKNLAEVIELQAAYWRKQFGALADQAREVRALSTQITADVAKQVKEPLTRGVDELRKSS